MLGNRRAGEAPALVTAARGRRSLPDRARFKESEVGRRQRFRLLPVAILMLLLASVATTGCMALHPTGESAEDQERSARIEKQLGWVDGFDWPEKVTVRGKRVTLWYWSEPLDLDDVEWEVHAVIDEIDSGEGWTLQLRNALTGDIYSTTEFSAWASPGEEFQVLPGVSLRVHGLWAGHWTRSPDATAPATPFFVLTIFEGDEDDVPPRTSEILVESYASAAQARAVQDAFAERSAAQGWTSEPTVAVDYLRLRVEARRFVRGGVTAGTPPSTVTEILVSDGGGPTARIVRFDSDEADARQATEDVELLARELLTLLDVRLGAASP
jgi:hypothetical protein